MSKMNEDQIKRHNENPNILLKILGKSFRCECGCNVFHHPQNETDGSMDDEIFKCNSCNLVYIGEN